MKKPAFANVARVDFDHFSGFGILQHEPPKRRQLLFKTVAYVDGNEVVSPVRLAQHRKGEFRQRRRTLWFAVIVAQKVRQHYSDRPVRSYPEQEFEGAVQVSARINGLIKQHFSNDS